MEPLLTLALTTGMRQGELLGLTWPAVDLVAGQLEVRATLVRSGGPCGLAEPKTARSRRLVRLTPTAISALRAHRARQAEAKLGLAGAWPNHSLVFTGSWGDPLGGRHITSRSFRAVLDRASLPQDPIS